MLMPKKEVSQAAEGSAAVKRGVGLLCRWRVRIEGHGMALHHRSSDRGQPYCHDAFHQRGGKIWLRLFPESRSQEPAKSVWARVRRVGSLVAVVRPGKILFEMEGVTPDSCRGSHASGVEQAAAEDEFVSGRVLRRPQLRQSNKANRILCLSAGGLGR